MCVSGLLTGCVAQFVVCQKLTGWRFHVIEQLLVSTQQLMVRGNKKHKEAAVHPEGRFGSTETMSRDEMFAESEEDNSSSQ